MKTNQINAKIDISVVIPILNEQDNIEMCRCGLHASLVPKDAKKYSPNNTVLTKVKVWGEIHIGKDKLVATDRQIIEV